MEFSFLVFLFVGKEKSPLKMAMAAFNTMTAIKKKMHGMKTSKETVFDRVDQLEQKLVEHKAVYEKV